MFGVIVVVEVVLFIVFRNEHVYYYFVFEGWLAFGLVYGFVSCVVIIFVFKVIGKLWFMCKEDHYGF